MSCQIDIYAGLLGCGKTTLIRRLLETEYAGQKVAVIENEIGKINLDGQVLKKTGITVQEMTGGCVCCTIQGAFERAIDMLIDEVHPDRILIEPTGAADLTGITEVCRKAKKAEIRRVLMIVNAKKLPALLQVVGEFYREQIRLADCVYLNFTEKMKAKQIKEAKSLIYELHPGVTIIDTPIQEITVQTFVDVKPYVDVSGGKRKDLVIQELETEAKKRALIQGKRADIVTYLLQIPGSLSETEVEKLKRILCDRTYLDLWRAKGIVCLQDGTCRRLDYTFGDIFEEDITENIQERENVGQIVLIGPSIDRKWVETEIRDFSQ